MFFEWRGVVAELVEQYTESPDIFGMKQWQLSVSTVNQLGKIPTYRKVNRPVSLVMAPPSPDFDTAMWCDD